MTYDDEHLPDPPNVQKKEIQNYLKRVRKEAKFRYFIIGEYGTKTWRPHYHMCLFGLSKIYVDMLYNKWGKCNTERFQVGEINEKTAQYTAGYTTEKLVKREAFTTNGLQPEFMLSSRANGGIGYPAIIQIAKKWCNSKWCDDRIIRDLRAGKIDLPLGRYLTQKLSALLKVPQSKLDAEYWLHQEEIFEKHLNGDAVDYFENIVEEDATKYHRQETKHRMFKNRSI